MTSIVVCGAAGRMGQAVLGAAESDPEVSVNALVENEGHAAVGTVVRTGGRELTVGVRLPSEGQVTVVDFTTPEATIKHAQEAALRGFPMVVGTTGFTPAQEREIDHAARRIAVVQSANMSVGVNVLWRLAEEAARLLDGADVEIIEAHHGGKADAPSGTALTAAALIAGARGDAGEPNLRHGRVGRPGSRPRGEIGMHAIRGGDIAGDHTVLFVSNGERLELTHRAHGREGFARGALRAARFATAARPGRYTMRQVLGLDGKG